MESVATLRTKIKNYFLGKVMIILIFASNWCQIVTGPSIRIAAVSNIQQMLQAKKAIQEKINQGIKVNERTTIAQTVSHGGSRVAHTPSAKVIRPFLLIHAFNINFEC